MRFSDYIFLAFRNIRRQKLRSVLTIFAIVIGSTSVAIMLTIVFSAKGFINNQFESNGTFQQIQVSPQQSIQWGNNNGDCQGQQGSVPGCVKLTDGLVAKITALPHVIGISRETQINGVFNGLFLGSKKLQIQQMVAYDTNGIIASNMLAGRDINAGDGPGVLTITSDYANALGYKNNYKALIGQTVTLNSNGYYSGVGSNPQAQAEYIQNNCNMGGQNCSPPATQLTARIVGIADSNSPVGSSSYTIRVPLSWARGMEEQQSYQQVSNQPSNCQNPRVPCEYAPPKPTLTVTDGLATNGYSELIVKVDSASNAAAVAKNITNQFGVGAADAETAIKQQLAVFNIVGLILGGIGGVALIVAAVGIVNTMVMSILERTREIGVMRAVGARRSTISRLFTFEASLLGFFGGLVGLLISYLLTLAGNPLINHALKGNNISSKNILAMPGWLIISTLVGTTVIGMLAGLYPARKAARLDPVEALRFE